MVHKIRKPFQKKIEINTLFERPCNELKNVTSKLKILTSKLGNVKKFKILPNLCLNFDFMSAFGF